MWPLAVDADRARAAPHARPERQMKRIAALTLCCCLLPGLAALAEASAKYFRVSHEHFVECADKAADLYFLVEGQMERNILSHLTATSTIYAQKAFLVMTLADLHQRMIAKRDRQTVKERIIEIKDYILSATPGEIKLLSDMIENVSNPDVRYIGNQLINEIRVFERNTGNY